MTISGAALTTAQQAQQDNRGDGGKYATLRTEENTADCLHRGSGTPQGTEAEFDAQYNLVTIEGTVDDTNFEDYDTALAAAGGNARRVWTVTESDYPVGEKIWKFDRDGDEEVVTADTFEDACDLAAEAFNGRFDADEEEDEDNQPVDGDFMADRLEGVYTGDQFDYEDEWVPVNDMSISAGAHRVNHLYNIVTAEEWTDESESYSY